MKFLAALRFAALMSFAVHASVADAQLSSRTAHGGLFGSLVIWVPAGVEMTSEVPVANGRPFASSRVQLGSVRAADPNAAWMGYWGHEDRALAETFGSERSRRSNPAGSGFNVHRTQALFAADSRHVGPPTDVMASAVTIEDVTADLQGLDMNALAPQQLVTIAGIEVITTAPEPETYILAAVGLVVIALIRRSGLA